VGGGAGGVVLFCCQSTGPRSNYIYILVLVSSPIRIRTIPLSAFVPLVYSFRVS